MAGRTGTGGLLVGLLILTATVYAQTWSHGFVYEDDTWRSGVDQAPASYPLPGRALTYLTQHLTLRIAGDEPALYHMGNLALHLLNGVLLWAVVRRMVPALALWATGLFLLHPLASSAVAYVTGRADLLVVLFTLLALWCGLQRGWWLVGVPLALLAAAMSKEVGVLAVPLVTLTLMVWRRDQVTTWLVSA